MTKKPDASRLAELCSRWHNGETLSDLAKQEGVPRQTFSHWIRSYDAERRAREEASSHPEIGMPEFPLDDLPVEDVIDHLTKRFEVKNASFKAHTWFPIKIKSKLPVAIVWVGDPHVDDGGCNWVLLRRDIDLITSTEGCYAANVGDTTNNWSGRLVRLYAQQDTSVSTARQLAQWLMLDSGVTWLIWVLGNHDAWGDGSAILAQMAKRYQTHRLICHDWEARFTLDFGDWTQRVFLAHDFKGSSIWNPMHGPMREGQLGEDADLFVCGHRHQSGMFTFENVGRGKVQTFIRVRGYKFHDDHARRGGFKEQEQGCAAITVFDPSTRTSTSFLDVPTGIEFLKQRREAVANGKG